MTGIVIVHYNGNNIAEVQKCLPHLSVKHSGTNYIDVSDSDGNTETVWAGMSIVSIPMLFGHFAWSVSKMHVFKGEIS